jgi:ribosomal protein L7/L12
VSNKYSEVIKRLSENLDWKRIVFYTASISPTIVLKALDFDRKIREKEEEPEYIKRCKKLIRGNLKIQAIKHCRENNTYMSLLDAKNKIDQFSEEMKGPRF